MKLIGLTGGIASGKSTVARLLAERGVPIIDADQLAREVVEPDRPAWREIAARWPQVIRPDRTLDRAKLGAIVFADADERKALSRITIPRIAEATFERVTALRERGEPIAVFEAATLFEEGLEGMVNGVLVVSLPPAEQVKRLMARNGLTEQEAWARLNAQLPLEEKVRRATWVLENSGTPEELRDKVAAIWEKIRAE